MKDFWFTLTTRALSPYLPFPFSFSVDGCDAVWNTDCLGVHTQQCAINALPLCI